MGSESNAATSSRRATSSRSTSDRERSPLGEDAGVYCLLLRLPRPCLIVAEALGARRLSSRWYIYTGSAKRNLRSRLAWHLRRAKPVRWHIDGVRAVATLERVWVWPWSPGMECRTNALIQSLPGAWVPWKGFGSSDCRCGSHLTALPTKPSLRRCGDGQPSVSLPRFSLVRELTRRKKGRILYPSASGRREKERV